MDVSDSENEQNKLPWESCWGSHESATGEQNGARFEFDWPRNWFHYQNKSKMQRQIILFIVISRFLEEF